MHNFSLVYTYERVDKLAKYLACISLSQVASRLHLHIVPQVSQCVEGHYYSDVLMLIDDDVLYLADATDSYQVIHYLHLILDVLKQVLLLDFLNTHQLQATQNVVLLILTKARNTNHARAQNLAYLVNSTLLRIVVLLDVAVCGSVSALELVEVHFIFNRSLLYKQLRFLIKRLRPTLRPTTTSICLALNIILRLSVSIPGRPPLPRRLGLPFIRCTIQIILLLLALLLDLGLFAPPSLWGLGTIRTSCRRLRPLLFRFGWCCSNWWRSWLGSIHSIFERIHLTILRLKFRHLRIILLALFLHHKIVRQQVLRQVFYLSSLPALISLLGYCGTTPISPIPPSSSDAPRRPQPLILPDLIINLHQLLCQRVVLVG